MLVDALRPPAVRTLAAVRIDLLVFVAIAVYLIAHLPTLEAWPTAHNDEAREMNAFWVASGADPQARSLDPEFGPDPLYKGGLQGLSVGLMFRLAGLGLFQGRLVSLVWGCLLLVVVFLLGRRLYGPLAGALAAFLLALSRPFLVASHMVRPEIVLAAMLGAACYLALRGVEQQPVGPARPSASSGQVLANGAAGLLLGLALDVHLNALAFVPLVALVYWRYRRSFWRERPTQFFLGGFAASVLYYLATRVFADPGQFAAASDYWLGIDKRPPVLSGDPLWMLGAELARFQSYFTEDRRLELGVLLAAVVVAAVRAIRSRRSDPLLLGLLAALLVFVVLVSSKSEFYVVLFYPWLALVLAGVLVWLLELAPRFRAASAVLAVVAAPLTFGVPDNYEDMATAAANFEDRGYYALVDEIRQVVPTGASIIGPPLFWIGLSDHPYTDYYVWERLRAQTRERFSSYVMRLKPELAVLDAKSRHQISINSPGYLESNGVLLKTIRHVGFDRVEVWKLSL